MKDRIESIAALEAVIGATPPPVNFKVIDHLDAHALRWLTASPLMFAAFGNGSSIAVTLGGGAPGFCIAEAGGLRLPVDMLDDPGLARSGIGFGSLWLAPGIGETLRINGRVADVGDGAIAIAVEECYVHCAKALIRSDFWAAAPLEAISGDAADFVAASRFMALATVDPSGRTDLSPKGDPAGSLARIEDGQLWFADRPGNRRADSFRNILAQPRVAAALLVPGSDQLALVSGSAQLTTDADARAAFRVQEKTPLLAIGVGDATIALRHSPALARARLWPSGGRPDGIEPAKIFAAHVRLNKDRSLAARVAGAVVSIPGLLRRGLEKDYKSNLY